MDWIPALHKLFRFKKYYDKLKKVKKNYDYSKKISKSDPNKLTWDDLKVFDNNTMNEATKLARELLKRTKAAEKVKLTWPKCDSFKAFMVAVKTADKFGIDSPETKRALEQYLYVLMKFNYDLVVLKSELKAQKPDFKRNIQVALEFEKYSDTLYKAFWVAAQVPSIYGTTQNAMFFALSEDAIQYGSLVSRIASSFQRLEKQNLGYLKDCEAMIKQNKAWIDWAASSYIANEGALKKNRKAKKPKR
ncbi:MAG: hypothetical protein JKY31_03850 [Rhodobacteraceae bacterium]|nr:hypothetical protein [Paracoccaceae bacterium]